MIKPVQIKILGMYICTKQIYFEMSCNTCFWCYRNKNELFLYRTVSLLKAEPLELYGKSLFVYSGLVNVLKLN